MASGAAGGEFDQESHTAPACVLSLGGLYNHAQCAWRPTEWGGGPLSSLASCVLFVCVMFS